MLTIVTLNLLNDLRFWPERSPLIIDNLRLLSPDLIAFQEVALPENNALWLAEQLGGYATHLCPYANRRGQREGLAILSRLPVEKHETQALGAQNRVAQRVILHHAGHHWMFANTHLFWSPFDDPIRVRQVDRLLNWMPTRSRIHTVICGDFNATPGYRAIQLMKRCYKSAHETFTGSEPAFTFPTPLKRGPGLRHAARRTALRAVGQALDTSCPSWCGTVDFIFLSQEIEVFDCQVAFDQPDPDDGSIYPSDHFGLLAKLILPDH